MLTGFRLITVSAFILPDKGLWLVTLDALLGPTSGIQDLPVSTRAIVLALDAREVQLIAVGIWAMVLEQGNSLIEGHALEVLDIHYCSLWTPGYSIGWSFRHRGALERTKKVLIWQNH